MEKPKHEVLLKMPFADVTVVFCEGGRLDRVRLQPPGSAEKPEGSGKLCGRAAEAVAAIRAYAEFPGGLDSRAWLAEHCVRRETPFEQKVWRALCDIPCGETETYGALARRIGVPGGARAVARAASLNPLPVLIPCHRLVGAGGRLTGFAQSSEPEFLEIKRRLIEREQEKLVRWWF